MFFWKLNSDGDVRERERTGKEYPKKGKKNSLFLNVTVTSGDTVVKNLPADAGNTGNMGSIPGLGRFPWRKVWQPTPVFLPGESHGRKNLEGYVSQGHRVGMTEAT